MAECSKCGKQSMSFTCRYCGEKFCSEHRLPEKHDCEGLESGKKEEFKQSSESSDQKWFDDKFSNKKSGKQKREKEFQRPGFWNETKRILKSNIALLIIGVTGLSFLLHQASPLFKQFLTLSPALSEAAVQTTNAAWQEIYPGSANLLNATFFDRWWSLFTIMLVHSGLFHFLANMITFYFFGSAVEKALGGMKMLKIYLIAGLASSIGYIAFRNILYAIYGASANGIPSLFPAVGASGAVIAMVGLTAMLYPEAEVLLYFVIPMKIKTAVKAFAVIEIFSLATKLAALPIPILENLAASAHLTGLAVGLYFGYKLKDRYGRRSSVFDPIGY